MIGKLQTIAETVFDGQEAR